MNKKRHQENLIQNEMKNLFLRKLDFTSDTNKICEKGSEELRDYYKTGDGEKLGLKDGKIESGDNPEHIDALVNLVSGEGDTTENATTYAMHLIPVIIFLAIAILSIPGWIICCICNCSNCCCCCCCKKPSCKLPFYIVTLVIYAFVAAICIYGLSQSNSIFVGLADTECSLLKFTGEVLDGETKETKPKWAGISGIQDLFKKTKDEINRLKADTTRLSNSGRGDVDDAKNAFVGGLETQSGYINNPSYHKETLDGTDYKLDIIEQFGSFSSGTATPNQPSILMYAWFKEYDETASQADSYMNTIQQNYDQLTSSSEATQALEKGIDSIDDIRKSFDEVKSQISGIIIDYSDTIDEYGKLGFKIVFSALLIIDLGIAAFITLLFFCSFQTCQNCCIRCILKSFLHILWNVLALLTIFTLLFGFILTLFGTVGKDLISVVEYLVSDKNLDKKEPVLLGEASVYLKKCINGNGDISNELKLDTDSLDNINQLNTAIININKVIAEVEKREDGAFSYKEYYKLFDDRVNYKTDFVIKSNTGTLSYSTYVNALNSGQTDIDWSNSCEGRSSTISCTGTLTGATDHTCVDLKTCTADQISTHYGSSSLADEAAKLNTIVKITNKENSDIIQNLKKVLETLNDLYIDFITKEKDTLVIYRDAIKDLTDIFNNLVGNGNIYSLINCLFIGRNVKIILKNLENSLGTNIYNVGVCLLTSGVAMLVSISFTILLNIIFNTKDQTPPMK